MTKRDYYEVLEVTRTASGRRSRNPTASFRGESFIRTKTRAITPRRKSSRNLARPTTSCPMTASARPTTASATAPLRKAVARRAAEVVAFTIRSIFSAKSSARAAEAAPQIFSSNSSAAPPARRGPIAMASSAVPICATTCRFGSRRPRSVATRRSKFQAEAAAAGHRRRGRLEGGLVPAVRRPRSGGQFARIFQVSDVPRRGTGQVIERPAASAAKAAWNRPRASSSRSAGIEDGSRLRSSRNGEAASAAARPRPLRGYPHQRSTKSLNEENNLFCEIP